MAHPHPPGQPTPVEPAEDAWLRPDPALLRLRRTVTLVLVGALVLTATAVAAALSDPTTALAVLAVGLGLLGMLLLAVERRTRAWGYYEREDDLLVRRGVLVRRLSVVPYGRMQYVDVVAGPLARRYGLATVTLHTAAAATDAYVPGLRADEATRLRDRLAALGEARQAGL
ncbi:MAG TPA: PH domain-containing protein [Mycobacteriales bacterium]|nr:PH domain-containing protein [Mycobacteriales bacterium]